MANDDHDDGPPDDLPPPPRPVVAQEFYALLGRVHYAARRGDYTTAAEALRPLNSERRERVLAEVAEGDRHLIAAELRDME